MSVVIELYKALGKGPNRALGPFGQVEIRHRGLVADGSVVALRHADGLWRLPSGDAKTGYLAARLSVQGGKLGSLQFVRGWKRGSEFGRPMREVRLQGDSLYLGTQQEPIAHDVDDDRSWQTRAGGYAYQAVLLAA